MCLAQNAIQKGFDEKCSVSLKGVQRYMEEKYGGSPLDLYLSGKMSGDKCRVELWVPRATR